MDIKINNLEISAVMDAIECYLEIVDNPLDTHALKSFVNKISNQVRNSNQPVEEKVVENNICLDDIIEAEGWKILEAADHD